MPVFTTICLFNWWVLLLSCVGCTNLPPNTSSVFKKGNEQLAKGDYAHAIGTYRVLEREGVQRAELYCNTGNAFYKAGEVGWAVYYYEKGLAVAPMDSQLLANREAALQRAKINSVMNSLSPLKQIVGLKNADIIAEIAVISILISGFLFLYNTIFIIKTENKNRHAYYKYPLLAGSLLLLISGVILFPLEQQKAIIVQSETVGRAGPSSAAKKIFEARVGERVEIQSYYKEWVKIQMQSGEYGWVTTSSAVSLTQ